MTKEQKIRKRKALKMREWRKNNRERDQRNARRYRKNNRDKIRAANRRYAEKHPEKIKSKDRRRYKRNREKEQKRNLAYHVKNREAIAKRHRNNRHRITQEQYDAKLKKQRYKCAVCKRKFKKTPHVDHDHDCCTSAITCGKCNRGLLCDDCNLGLGRFKDDATILSNAIEYLKGWSNDS